jgi:hypothetical protein
MLLGLGLVRVRLYEPVPTLFSLDELLLRELRLELRPLKRLRRAWKESLGLGELKQEHRPLMPLKRVRKRRDKPGMLRVSGSARNSTKACTKWQTA